MNIFDLILLAIGVSMDAFAVSIAKGLATQQLRPRHYASVALWFGGFQALMPAVGFFCGSFFADFVNSFSHWIAFVLLLIIGGNMIKESREGDAECCDASMDVKTMLMLAIATSIDALATGLIFVPLGNLMYSASAIIALVSFLFTIVGCVLGITFGKRIKFNVEAIGGLILIGIGLKIFIEHMFC
jgi:putative Mn2+ efflux pump MntP